jgi:hypothetical protein
LILKQSLAWRKYTYLGVVSVSPVYVENVDISCRQAHEAAAEAVGPRRTGDKVTD